MSLTAEQLARLHPAERILFTTAAQMLARGENPGPNVTAGLVLTIERLLTEER